MAKKKQSEDDGQYKVGDQDKPKVKLETASKAASG
jgi:hypothetical protein